MVTGTLKLYMFVLDSEAYNIILCGRLAIATAVEN